MRKALLFLGVLNDSDLDWMIAAGTKKDVPPGSILIQEGREVEWLFLVLDGVLTVTRGTGPAIARLMTGEIVGEISFVDKRPPSASVQALERSTVLAIPRRDIEAKLAADLHFASRFYRALAIFLADRLRTTIGQLGYGKGQEEATAADEIDPDVLDNISIAGARFDWLQRRLKAI